MPTSETSNARANASGHSVPTRAMASLISEYAPETLLSLRETFPDQVHLFDTTYTLGEDGPDVITPLPAEETGLLALKAMIEKTIAISEPIIGQIINALSKRSRTARRAKLAGSIIAGTSSVSVLSSLAASHPEIAIISSLLGFLASISVMVGEHLDKSIVGGQKSIGELLGATMLAESHLKDIQLIFMSEDLKQKTIVLDLARKANDLASKIKEICVFGGVPLRAT